VEDFEQIRSHAREIYTNCIISHAKLADLLDKEFRKPVDVETLKQWGKQEGWTDERRKNLGAQAGDDRQRIQAMKDIVYDEMLMARDPLDLSRLASAYATLIKTEQSLLPQSGGEPKPDDLIKK
jgi:hypothetical protein